MRGFSSSIHHPIIRTPDTRLVRVVDPTLPAVQHLVGKQAVDVLRLPVEAAGGRIEDVRPVHVQFRPGSDVIVRYSAQISWDGQPSVRETLVASSTAWGVHPGTVVITADTSDGPIEVGVWRWPFDPALRGLGAVVSAESVGSLLDLDPRHLVVDIVAYRPTERAVIRVSSTVVDGHGDPSEHVHAYIKVVEPSTVRSIADRHGCLLAAGVAVPAVNTIDEANGLLVLEPLRGPTLRQLVKGAPGAWPTTDEFDRLADSFAAADLAGGSVPSKLTDGALHAHMLASVLSLPAQRSRLEALATIFEQTPIPPADSIIHGDLHEAQLIIVDGMIRGVLDIDDAGPGAAIDDRANLIARLLYRTVVADMDTTTIVTYADMVRSESTRRFDAHQLDVHIAACLIGLATGPFRLQAPGWERNVTDLVECAEHLTMRELSDSTHRGLTQPWAT